MSDLKTKIQGDANSALRSHDEARRLILGSLIAALQNKEIEKRTSLIKKSQLGADQIEKESRLSDDEVIQVIQSETKKRKEAIEIYTKGGREDLAKKEESEAKILTEYLPKQLSEVELKKIVQDTVSALGVKDVKEMGKAISAVMGKVKGRADGSSVSRFVKECIN
jgi:uncharacterized protein